MGDTDRREIARARTVEVLRILRANIKNDPQVNVTRAAAEAGVAPSTFYRWLSSPPQSIDMVQVVAVSDFLHDEYGHADFATIWRDVAARIK
ncbi:hypothetical protein J2Y46_002561 [Microbacterium sp. BE35]|uniref:hypothetical protein n=1 Tax=Microbacterium sp. BE35 TaxID=2817773 RepID=UPI0028588B84|nr:hypothetical protein [Microbacterium sp. BE35]MDR7189735.1 hypothetical protein [Microbacterium sp. BE35]